MAVREMVPKCKWEGLPEPSTASDLVLELYREAQGLGAGSPVECVRWRCGQLGLSEAQAVEVWVRACLVRAVVSNYQAMMAEAEAAARARRN